MSWHNLIMHLPQNFLLTKNVYDLLALIQSNYPFSCQGNIRIPMLLGNEAEDDIILPYLGMCLIM